MSKLSKSLNLISTASLRLAEATVVAMLLIMSVLVVTRYVFSYSMPWAEEATRYLLVWATLFAAVHLLREQDHIRVDFFVAYLPKGFRTVLSLIGDLLIAVFLVILIYQSILVMKSIAITRSPSLDVPMSVPYLALPVTAALMLLFVCVHFLETLTGRAQTPPAHGHQSPASGSDEN